MKKVIALFRDYFGVSQREARGMLALLVLSGFLVLLPMLFRFWVPDSIPDTAPSDQRQLDSLVALLEAGKTGRDAPEYAVGRDEPVGETRKIERFSFNPNTIDAESWQRLGVPRWLAERIIRYRTKGGRFRQKADLLKIYDFSPDLYAELEPYIRVDGQGVADRPTIGAAARFSTSEATREKPPGAEAEPLGRVRFSRPVLQPFDINTADTTELKKLRGIGSKLASRVLKFREALGGFVSPDQYAEIFGLDSLALAELTRYGRVETPAKKIAVNTATVEELDRHVYLSRRQAEVIVNYRNQHGPYPSPDALRTIRVLDARTIEKLTPYLVF
ncbi:ComEA family DNA-binding protein [Larkinella bovis]|uniref:ComEA family DNA-binding protein n=1 Tax=Larkinella bovis TaxID=683041 RepID=A0ABW0I6K9_9BACT